MTHKLGQVFLIDQNIVRKILLEADINDTDYILEIGCGDGVLSKEIAPLAKQLNIVEIDEKCIISTKKVCDKYQNITYIHDDILNVVVTNNPQPWKVIANIPYYLSAKIIQHFVTHRASINRMIVMVQKEFAEKLVAKVGGKEHTSLSLYTQFYFDINHLFNVSRQCFKPIPKVDSAVIELLPKKTPMFDVDEDVFFSMIHSAFWGRRKQLLSALKKSPYITVSDQIDGCQFFKDHPKIRGELLTLTDFYELYQQLMVTKCISVKKREL